MRYFVESLIPKIDLRWKTIRPHVVPFVLIVSFIMLLYYCSTHVRPGPFTYFIAACIGILIGLTALARLNDIPHENFDPRWQLRRLGLILAMAGAATIVLAPGYTLLAKGSPDWPEWRDIMFYLGVLFTWMTTPMMPPWWRYISGEYKRDTSNKEQGP